MQLFVRSLDRTFVVSLDETATVNDLKNAIEDVEFIPSGKLFPYFKIMCVTVFMYRFAETCQWNLVFGRRQRV